ncbi:hypothetical protein ACLKA6_017744 [Drosophila palustris]
MQHTVLPAYDDMKLPRISIPTFSGKFINWPAFKKVFQARVHNRTRLNDLHRFYYLRDSFSEDTARDIQHLTLIESNYQVAWKMLEEFYDNKRLLFQHYVDVFDQQSSVQHDRSDSQKCFIQTCRSCVHSLDKSGSGEAASKNQRASAKQFSDSNKQKEDKRLSALDIVCNMEEHPIRTYKAFNDMSVSELRATASKHRLCFNCLGFNHQ